MEKEKLKKIRHFLSDQIMVVWLVLVSLVTGNYMISISSENKILFIQYLPLVLLFFAVFLGDDDIWDNKKNKKIKKTKEIKKTKDIKKDIVTDW